MDSPHDMKENWTVWEFDRWCQAVGHPSSAHREIVAGREECCHPLPTTVLDRSHPRMNQFVTVGQNRLGAVATKSLWLA